MTRLAVSLNRFGGWGEHTISLPEAPDGWSEVFTGRTFAAGPMRIAELLTDLPVALLRRA